MSRRNSIGAWLATASMLVSGCSRKPPIDYSSVQLATVTGTITLDGEPLVGAQIDFAIPNSVPYLASSGTTDADGEYEMVYDSYAKGVTPGDKVVRIFGKRPDEGESPTVGAVPARYNRESELRVTVEPNGSHVFDFDLTSD